LEYVGLALTSMNEMVGILEGGRIHDKVARGGHYEA